MYAKLFSSIIHSTVWREDMHVKVVWITMLAMADAGGSVFASIPGLADAARVTIPQVEDALTKFLSPDPYSRTQEHEGRRIEVIPGGWKILNYVMYREIRNAETRRIQNAEAQARYREKHKIVPLDDDVSSNADSNVVSQKSAQAEADASQIQKEPLPPSTPPKPTPVEDEGFTEFWEKYPRKVGKLNARKAWKKTKGIPLERILNAVDVWTASEEWTKDGGKYIPHPETWLNRGGWDDQVVPAGGNGHGKMDKHLALFEEMKRAAETDDKELQFVYDWHDYVLKNGDIHPEEYRENVWEGPQDA